MIPVLVLGTYRSNGIRLVSISMGFLVIIPHFAWNMIKLRRYIHTQCDRLTSPPATVDEHRVSPLASHSNRTPQKQRSRPFPNTNLNTIPSGDEGKTQRHQSTKGFTSLNAKNTLKNKDHNFDKEQEEGKTYSGGEVGFRRSIRVSVEYLSRIGSDTSMPQSIYKRKSVSRETSDSPGAKLRKSSVTGSQGFDRGRLSGIVTNSPGGESRKLPATISTARTVSITRSLSLGPTFQIPASVERQSSVPNRDRTLSQRSPPKPMSLKKRPFGRGETLESRERDMRPSPIVKRGSQTRATISSQYIVKNIGPRLDRLLVCIVIVGSVELSVTVISAFIMFTTSDSVPYSERYARSPTSPTSLSLFAGSIADLMLIYYSWVRPKKVRKAFEAMWSCSRSLLCLCSCSCSESCKPTWIKSWKASWNKSTKTVKKRASLGRPTAKGDRDWPCMAQI
ncbi:hypothetical protein AAMO2058_000023100 [Amorphochlora amoebiformis]